MRRVAARAAEVAARREVAPERVCSTVAQTASSVPLMVRVVMETVPGLKRGFAGVDLSSDGCGL